MSCCSVVFASSLEADGKVLNDVHLIAADLVPSSMYCKQGQRGDRMR